MTHAGPTLPPITSANINSLNALRPGGLTGDFFKTVSFIACLIAAQGIICLQDTRIPTADFAQTLSSIPQFFDCQIYSTGSGDRRSGGCVIMVHNTVKSKFHVRHATIIQGAAHFIELVNKEDDKAYYVFNIYLDAGDEDRWRQQIKTLTDWNCPPNSIYVGDFNHVTSPEQRSGYHSDKTKYGSTLFDRWLKDCKLEEVEQPFHTYYSKRDGRLTSSQIDKFYTNFDYVMLDTLRPTASVMTCVPYSIAQYDKTHSSDRNGDQDKRDVTRGHRVLQDFKLVKDGGTHVTDHLPIRLKFECQLSGPPPIFFPTHALKDPRFQPTFKTQWEREMRPNEPFAKWREFKDTVIAVSKSMKKKHKVEDKSTEVFSMLKLLRALEQPKEKQAQILEHYHHFPQLEEWKNNPDSLVSAINNRLAEAAYDAPSSDPSSKLAYLAATLPRDKTRLDSVYDPDEQRETDNPQRVTEIIHRFWKDKWQAKPTSKTRRLFRCYGKKITQEAKDITIEDIAQTILETNDTAPGPDSIPFAAYRSLVDIAAPILHACISSCARGPARRLTLTRGSLFYCRRKGWALSRIPGL